MDTCCHFMSLQIFPAHAAWPMPDLPVCPPSLLPSIPVLSSPAFALAPASRHCLPSPPSPSRRCRCASPTLTLEVVMGPLTMALSPLPLSSPVISKLGPALTPWRPPLVRARAAVPSHWPSCGFCAACGRRCPGPPRRRSRCSSGFPRRAPNAPSAARRTRLPPGSPAS